MNEPEEAASQFAKLAAEAFSDNAPKYVSKRRWELICEYALYTVESLLSRDLSDLQMAAEYSLSLLAVDKTRTNKLLDEESTAFLINAMVAGSLESLSYLEGVDVDSSTSLLLEYATSSEIRKQKMAALSYLRLVQVLPEGALPAALEDTDLRVAIKNCIVNTLQRELRLAPTDNKTGWHEFLPLASARYSENWKELFDSCRTILHADDIVALSMRREELLRAINKVKPVSVSLEEKLLVELHELLTDLFTAYLNERETASVRAYGRLSARLDNVMSNIAGTPSNLGAAYGLPIVQHIRDLILIDYENRLQQGSPEIDLSIAKPYYPLSTPNHELEIQLHVTNTGALEAMGAEIWLKIRDEYTDKIRLLQETVDLGLVPVTTKPIAVPIGLVVTEVTRDAYIDYKVSWRGLAGREEREGELRIVAQRDVDWAQPNPYSLWPVEEPDRLKGRDQILQSISRGLLSGGSFYCTGQKRVGKTSIAKAVRTSASEWGWLAIEMLWGEVAGSDPAIALHYLASKIGKHAKVVFSEGTTDGVCPRRDEFFDSYSVAFSTFRERFHNCYPGVKLLVVIDDFDELPEQLYLGPSGNAFFAVLRAAVADPLITFIFVGGEKLRRIDTAQGTRLNNVISIKVDYLESPSDFRELVVYPVEGMLEYSEEAINRIFAVSAGNPFYATLVCRDIYDAAVNNRTAYIDGQDAERAVSKIAGSASEGQFNHFWQDGDHVGTEQEAYASDLNARLLLSLATCADSSNAWIPKAELDKSKVLLRYDDREVSRALAQLEARQVIVRNSREVYRFKVPLLAEWLRGRGSQTLHDALFDEETRRELDEETYKIRDADLSAISEALVYANERVNEIMISNWLGQFVEPRHRHLALELLRRLRSEGYTSSAEMQSLASNCYHRVQALAHDLTPQVTIRYDERPKSGARSQDKFGLTATTGRPANVFIATRDKPGDSGSVVVRLFRDVTRLKKPSYGALSDVVPRVRDYLNSRDDTALLLLVNDVVASGQSAIKDINAAVDLLERKVADWDQRVALCYVALVGVESAVEEVKRMVGDRAHILVGKELGERVRALAPDAEIFADEVERREAEKLVFSLGERLSPDSPLGWSNSGLLLLLPDNCPNNTLPIFWKETDSPEFTWKPLFPRK